MILATFCPKELYPAMLKISTGGLFGVLIILVMREVGIANGGVSQTLWNFFVWYCRKIILVSVFFDDFSSFECKRIRFFVIVEYMEKKNKKLVSLKAWLLKVKIKKKDFGF